MLRGFFGVLTHPTDWVEATKRFWKRTVSGDDRIRRLIVKGPPALFEEFLTRQLLRPHWGAAQRRRRKKLISLLVAWHRGEISHSHSTMRVHEYLSVGKGNHDSWFDLLGLSRVLMSVGLFRASLDSQRRAWELLESEVWRKPTLFSRYNYLLSLIYRGEIALAHRELETLTTMRHYPPITAAIPFLRWYLGVCSSSENQSVPWNVQGRNQPRWLERVAGQDVLIYGPGEVGNLPALRGGFLVSRIMGPGVFEWNNRDDLVSNQTNLVYSIRENIDNAMAPGGSTILEVLEKYDFVCVKKTDSFQSSHSRAVNAFSPLFSRGHPQMVPLAILDLISSGANPVVIGSDFFTSQIAYRPSDRRIAASMRESAEEKRQSAEGSDGGSFDRTSLMASHNILENWALIRNLFASGLVRGDSRFSAVMSMDPEQLMDVYDQNLGARRI